MKKWYVYELINLYGTVEYVGETSRVKGRMYEHFKLNPKKNSRNGKFYQRQDVIVNLVEEFDNRTDARKLETELKLLYGLPTTERDTSSKNGIKNRYDIVVYKVDGTFIGEYQSIKEFALLFNLSNGNVSEIVNGKRRQTKGYIIKKK